MEKQGPIAVININRCEECKHEKSIMEQAEDKSLHRRMICLRFPPMVGVVATPRGQMEFSKFPVVQPDWVCGEFVPKRNNS